MSTGYLPPKVEGKYVTVKPEKNIAPLDRFRGAIVGNAVGDALGGPLEFNSRDTCPDRFPDGIQEMLGGGPTGGKGPGSYTDDTEMLVAIGIAVEKADGICLDEIGKEFVRWYSEGHGVNDRRPPDIGGQTSTTCNSIRNGTRASEAGFKHNGPSSLGNGSLMRNGIIYVATHAAPLSQKLYAAEQVSAVTHAGRECRSSCAAMTYLQARLGDGLDAKTAIKDTRAFMEVWGADPKVLAALDRVISSKVEDLLTVCNTGYVTGTFERALLPLWHELGFEQGVIACVMQGGDADSAGAVCGSLLGTYYGASAIPERWLTAVYANEEKNRCPRGIPNLLKLTDQMVEVSDAAYAFPLK